MFGSTAILFKLGEARLTNECVFSRLVRHVLGIFTLGLVCLLAPSLFPGESAAGETYNRVTKSNVVRIGLPYNRIPQGFVNQSGEWVGFEVDFAQELAKHMGLQLDRVKINDKNWGQALTQGKVDAVLCRIVHRRSLETEFDFSVPYFFDSHNLMVHKDKFKSISDLKGNKIGALQGSISEKSAIKLLTRLGDENAEKNVVSFPDRASISFALGNNKVSAWLDSGMVLMEYVAQSPGRFELLPASDDVQGISIALPLDDSAWRDLINFGIQDMAADGTFKKIYDKWFGPDTAYNFPLKRTIEIWPE